jgi:tripartite-type tricarboxylate transporter receptor subunit TctC
VRPTVQDKGTEWSKQIAGGMRKVIKGQMTADDVLGAVGTLAAADIAKTIAAGDFTALSAATLAQRAAKGQGTAPLQATGLLIATIDSQVTDAS